MAERSSVSPKRRRGGLHFLRAENEIENSSNFLGRSGAFPAAYRGQDRMMEGVVLLGLRMEMAGYALTGPRAHVSILVLAKADVDAFHGCAAFDVGLVWA